MAGITKLELAEVFESMWNACIGESHRIQSDMGTAAILATGFSAMAEKLRELHHDEVEKGEFAEAIASAQLSVSK